MSFFDDLLKGWNEFSQGQSWPDNQPAPNTVGPKQDAWNRPQFNARQYGEQASRGYSGWMKDPTIRDLPPGLARTAGIELRKTDAERHDATRQAIAQLLGLEGDLFGEGGVFARTRENIGGLFAEDPYSDEMVDRQRTMASNEIDQLIQQATGVKASELSGRGIRGGGQTSAAAGEVASAAISDRVKMLGGLLDRQSTYNLDANERLARLLGQVGLAEAPYRSGIDTLKAQLERGDVGDPQQMMQLISGIMGAQTAEDQSQQLMNFAREEREALAPGEWDWVIDLGSDLLKMTGMERLGIFSEAIK